MIRHNQPPVTCAGMAGGTGRKGKAWVSLPQGPPVSSRKPEDGEELVKGSGLTADRVYMKESPGFTWTLSLPLCCAALALPVGGAD